MPRYDETQPESFKINRNDNVPLAFDGWLLSHVDSRDMMAEAQRLYRDRWADLSLYKTTTGKWVFAQVGKTREVGRRERSIVIVCTTPSDVLEALTHREGYVSKVHLALINAAMEVDPDLQVTEHI